MSIFQCKYQPKTGDFSKCANTEKLGRQVLRKSSSWFDFSSSQIRTRAGWVRSENATAVLCCPPLHKLEISHIKVKKPLAFLLRITISVECRWNLMFYQACELTDLGTFKQKLCSRAGEIRLAGH